MAAGTLLLEAGAMFAVLALAGTLAARFGQAVIPLYILGGMAVNPFVLGELGGPAIPEREFISLLAELGVVFLLFFLGLEFSIERLLGSRDRVVRAGAVDLALNFPVGVALGLVLGWSALEAFVLGGIVYVSSSAIITKSLIDLGWIANAESEPILGVLVFEDLFMAFYLAVVSSVLLGGAELEAVAGDVAVAMAFLLVLVAGVYYGGALFDRLLSVGTKELFVLRAVAATVLVAGVALAIGVSEAVAAFFIGMGFSSTDHIPDLEHLLAPVRDLFAAVFFFWIGLTTDPALLVTTAGLLAVTVAATVPSKLASGFLGGRLYGLDDRRAARVAAGLVTRGEFSLIIATLAAAGGTRVLSATIPALAVGYVLVMSILGSTLMQRVGVLEALAIRGDEAQTA